jgi:50S ribosomal protein L16 3-hydroxylase
MSNDDNLAVSAVPGAAVTSSIVAMNAERWSQFVRSDFEQRPALIAGATDGPLVNAQVVFETLCAAAESRRRDPEAATFTAWIERVTQSDAGPLLPLPRDGNLQSYLQRLHQVLGGREFALVLADAHLHNTNVERSTRRFVRGLFDESGFPCGGYDCNLFVGHYGITPFGVHRGMMSVLTLPVVGEKRFLMWPREYGDTHADLHDAMQYPQHLPHAVDLTVAPGDLLYWPADYWHVKDNVPAFTATLSMGLWWDRPPLARALLALSESLVQSLPDAKAAAIQDDSGASRLRLNPNKGNETALPEGLNNAVALIERIAQIGFVRSSLLMEWLAFLSSGGLRTPRPLGSASGAVRPDERLQIVEPGLLRTSTSLPGERVVAAGGHAMRLPDSSELARLLQLWADGVTATCDSVALTDPHVVEAIQTAVAFAVRAGALARV